MLVARGPDLMPAALICGVHGHTSGNDRRAAVLRAWTREIPTMSDEPTGAEGNTPRYSVMLLNDDATPMEFVVHVLEEFFDMDREDAIKLMLHIHHNGIGECGTYPQAEASRKVADVLASAREHQHRLQCVMELRN
jgi:ATP-dependent Clp protease adaptor protein ClpS